MNIEHNTGKAPLGIPFDNSPYREIPLCLVNDYTLGGTIPVVDWFFNNSDRGQSSIWTPELIDEYITANTIDNIFGRSSKLRYSYQYEKIHGLTHSFVKFGVEKKKVAVIGSTSPWIESVLLNLSNTVTTVEYNVPDCRDPRISVCTFAEFSKIGNDQLYDAVVSFSSIEHSGLGRYGDPLDPFGDTRVMDVIRSKLRSDGVLIIGFPCGPDVLVWNAHRIYGSIRLPLLLSGYNVLDWIGPGMDELLHTSSPSPPRGYQPVITLSPKSRVHDDYENKH